MSLLQAVIIIAFIIRQAAVVHLNSELRADLPVFATQLLHESHETTCHDRSRKRLYIPADMGGQSSPIPSKHILAYAALVDDPFLQRLGGSRVVPKIKVSRLSRTAAAC